LTGTITISKISTTSVSLSGGLAGQCGSQSSISLPFTGLTGTTWSGTVLGGSFTFTRTSTGIQAINNGASQCSGTAYETANSGTTIGSSAFLVIASIIITMVVTLFQW
jgi:hypothetical protein